MGSIVLSALVIIGIVTLSLCGMYIVRRVIPLSTIESHREVAGYIYAVIGGIYAVLVSFVVLVVWQQHNTAQERVEHEATSVTAIYRLSQGFHDAGFKSSIATVAKEYTETMIKNEFPAMGEETTSKENEDAYLKIWNIFYNYTPSNEHEKIWFEQELDALVKIQADRKLRKLSVEFGVPRLLWFVLVCGAVVTISFSLLFVTKRVLAHGVMVASLSFIIGLILILIGALENPFSGIIQVEQRAFVELLKIF